jgi:hypothetical protein
MKAIAELVEVRSEIFRICEASALAGQYSPPELKEWQRLTHEIELLQKGGA